MKHALFILALLASSPTMQADPLRDLLQRNLNVQLQKKLGVEGDPMLLGHISLEQERDVGREIAGRLLDVYPLLDDAKLQAYVNRVGRWVALQSDRPDLPWTFGVIRSNSVNAYAVPGGYVFVTEGLYRQLASEAELAGVLAHEIAHVQQKHHVRLLKKGQWLQAGSQLLSRELKDVEAADSIIGNGAELMARRLDQNAEYEADRMAVVLAARAGYDPLGLPQVLQKLEALREQDEGVLAALFSTHPDPAQRLEQLDLAIGDRLTRLKGSQTLPRRLYRLPPVAVPAP